MTRPRRTDRNEALAVADPAVILVEARQCIDAARFDEAGAQLYALLERKLDAEREVDALYMLAVTERYRQDYAAALDVTDRLVARRPEYGRAWQERGYACLALNNPRKATEAFSKAVELNAGLLASWKSLANLHARDGNERQARFAATQVEYLEDLPPELRGVIDLTHEGRLAKAEGLCRQYLQRHRQHVEGMRLLADIAVRLGIYDDAEFLLESCVEFAPDHLRARSDYLRILNRKGKFAQALKQARVLCRRQPTNPAYGIALANALTGVGRLEEGIERYRQCLDTGTNRAGVYLLLGHAHKANGEFESAIDAYREAYRLRPDYGDAFWSLANTKTYRFDDAEIEHMETRVDRAGLDADDRIHFCFAAGKAREDRRQFAQAFRHYERGNDKKRARTGYDPAVAARMVEAQVAACDERLFARRREAGCDRPDPIFIVGLPRSGSTLLEQILASHSMVDGTMELHNVLGVAQRLGGRTADRASRYPQILAELDPNYFRRFGEQYIESTRVYRGEAPYFIDKMPNNFMHVGLIRLMLPRARIIDARRDPMACCFSNFKQLFGEGQHFSYGLDLVARYYRDYVTLMDHWDRVLPGFVLRVRYEEVVEDLEEQVRRLLDFCGLPFEQACLEYHATDRSVRTPSSEQVRQPIYRSGLDQWRNFEAYLGPLKETLGHGFIAGVA